MKTLLLSSLMLVFFTFTVEAQNIAINSTGAAADASAMLDVNSTTSGMLIPRVLLTGVNDAATIPSPQTSLLVYNTNAALPAGAGFYYNANTPAAPVWTRLGSGNGTVTNIATGTGLTGGPITGTGTISMANMPANTVKGNNTGALAPPTDITIGANSVLGQLGGNITGIPFGTAANQVAWGNHTHATDHTRLHTMTNTSDHSANNWQVFYSNGANQVVELALGGAGLVLKSNGPAAAPSWQADIGGTGAALTRVDDANVTLTLGGTPATALLQATSLTLGWSGLLSIARGGTNSNAVPTAGAMAYGTGTAYAFTPVGAAGTILTSNGAAAPSWTAANAHTHATLSQGTGISVFSYNGSAAQTVGLANTGVAAGAYTNTNITVNAQGQITLASSGAAGVTGSGTVDYLARWTPTATNLGIGVTRDNNSTVGINAAPNASYRLYVDGASAITGIYGQYNANNYGWLGGSSWGGYVHGGVAGSTEAYTQLGKSNWEGVYAWAYNDDGVQGETQSSSYYGVYGNNTNATSGTGVYGRGTTYGVRGYTPSVAANTYGVFGEWWSSTYGYLGGYTGSYYVGAYGYVDGANDFAVFGNNNSSGGTGGLFSGDQPPAIYYLVGGSGLCSNGGEIGLAGFSNNATAADRAGGYFEDDLSGSWAYVGMRTAGGTSYKIIGASLNVSGIVKTTDGRKVVMFCPEAPEPILEDYGTGRLVDGKAHIDFDLTYSNSINTDENHPLKIFVQLEGDCNGVFLTNKNKYGFDVIELNGGKSDVAFVWHVVANTADQYNDDGSLFSKNFGLRFPDAPGPLKKQRITDIQSDGKINQQKLEEVKQLNEQERMRDEQKGK